MDNWLINHFGSVVHSVDLLSNLMLFLLLAFYFRNYDMIFSFKPYLFHEKYFLHFSILSCLEKWSDRKYFLAKLKFKKMISSLKELKTVFRNMIKYQSLD